jgi:hypothetical protein
VVRRYLDTNALNVGFVVDKLAVQEVILRVLVTLPSRIIPPVLHTFVISHQR